MLDSLRRTGGGTVAGPAGPAGPAAGWRPFERLWPHVWTVAPRLRNSLWRREPPPAEPWQATVEDPQLGTVRLSGRLHRCLPAPDAAAPGAPGAAGAAAASAAEASGESDELVVLLHGLGGSIDSYYMPRGALAALAAGMSCLRLNLRGADMSGEDFPHGGLTADVHAVVASPALRRYRRIYLLGYSLGGHLALRFATEPGDPRVVAVTALCSPLDLRRSQEAIDAPAGWIYRRYLLSHLTRIYATVAARRRLPLPVAEVARIRRMRDFDERVVAPRHGFASAADYYVRASVAPRLTLLRLPSLLVNSTGDPMVLAHAVRPALRRPVPRLAVRWVTGGGHVGFPASVDLGLDLLSGGAGGPGGAGNPPGGAGTRTGGAGHLIGAAGRGAATARPPLDDQVLAWLRRAADLRPAA